MDDKQTIDPVIVDWFTKTLLPIFSWLLSQLVSGVIGREITMVLLHPTTLFMSMVAGTWVENNELFSCAEILSFEKASGRRRGRKKLRKLLRPFFREMNGSPECLLFKQRFQEKLNKLREAVGDETPPEIPPNSRIEIDIAEIEKRRDESFTAYSQDDIVSVFPIGSTLADDNLKKRVAFEVDGYPETMRGLLWEASQDWNLLRQVSVRKDSEIWEILGFDPNDEPNLEALIDWALDFGLGEANEDKLMYLSRWFMDRVLVSQFILYPYSDKRFVSLQKRVADDLTLEDMIVEGDENKFPLSDGDRLSQFCELAGVDMDTLTGGDSNRILDILHALDEDYDFASKQGMAMRAYHGERADSEKTQRQRLFKKLREARGKAK